MTLSHRQLVIENLAFERDFNFLFNAIHCTLDAGDLLQICGANGCGKSTLLRILAGYIEPHEGNITWKKQFISQQLDQYQQQLHYLGHQNGVKPTLTVHENLQLFCALTKTEKKNLHAITQRVGLQAASNTQALHLSAGQNRRLALARLLLKASSIWILDEPTTALDHDGQLLLMDLLAEHLDNQGIAIVATHHPLKLTRPIKTLRLGASDA